MLDCVIVDSFARIVIGQKLSLIFSGESLEESSDLIHLRRCKFHTALVDTHITNSVLEGFAGTVMIIWPCMLHITESRNLETMTVALDLSVLITAVVLVSKLETTVSEIMTAESHKFVRLASEVWTDMACRAIILLEKFISGKFISSQG